MKFDPITNTLYTNEGTFIKKMSCPLKIDWNDLTISKKVPYKRDCSACNHQIIDTRYFSDNELIEIMKADPTTCLKVEFDQTNIEIRVTNESF